MTRGWLALALLVSMACQAGTEPEGTEAPSARPSAHATVGVRVAAGEWDVAVTEVTTERSVRGLHGELFEAREHEVFLLVGAELQNPDPGSEREFTSEGATLVTEDGVRYPARGAGEEGVCLDCEFGASTSDEEVALRFLFVLPQVPRGTMAFRYQGSEPILLSLSGDIDPAVAAIDAVPVTENAAAGWQRVDPGGRTICARGDPFAFWAHEGSTDRLLLYFGPGGGCFDYASCAPGSALFADVVDPNAVVGAGILDVSDRENPFRRHTIVAIPSCTGDVHWGDARATYRSRNGQEVVIEHRGFVNAKAALRWAYHHVPSPRSVFVTGCSAGSVGSAAHVPFVIDRYPNARISQLGDSLALVFHRPIDLQEDYGAHDNFPPWIERLRPIRPGSFRMSTYYRILAGRYPDVTFAQFNYAHDFVQTMFYEAIGGDRDDFTGALLDDLRRIRRSAANFRTYTDPGAGHCILEDRAFFTHRRGAVTLRDWVASLAAGRPVRNVGLR
jgi:hypothetical protein